MKLSEYLNGNMEIIPTDFLEHMSKHEGKPLNVRQIPEGMRIRKQYGMTHIYTSEKDGKRVPVDPKKQYSFLIDHSEKNVIVPSPETIREKNPCYFEGAEERNNARKVIADNPEALESMIAQYQHHKKQMEILQEAIKNSVSYQINTEIERFANQVPL